MRDLSMLFIPDFTCSAKFLVTSSGWSSTPDLSSIQPWSPSNTVMRTPPCEILRSSTPSRKAKTVCWPLEMYSTRSFDGSRQIARYDVNHKSSPLEPKCDAPLAIGIVDIQVSAPAQRGN